MNESATLEFEETYIALEMTCINLRLNNDKYRHTNFSFKSVLSRSNHFTFTIVQPFNNLHTETTPNPQSSISYNVFGLEPTTDMSVT